MTVTLLFVLAGATAADASLTEGPRLAAIYDLILDARFDAARARMTETCPPAPREACRVLEVVAIWWRIQLNPNSRALDKTFQEAAASATAAAEAWTKREPNRGEAWFYLAGSHAPVVQWRVLRGQPLAAAREAKKIKEALERSLALDPSLQDAYFGIGVYHYYADVAPAALKFLRWLLLLPGGDREQGLREMLQGRNRGELLRGEADYQLHFVYLWYEHDSGRALQLLRALDRRYPSNPVFLQRIAEVQHEYLHDHAASAAAWQQLIARERAGRAPAIRLAYAQLQLGVEFGHLGDRSRALEALNAAMAIAPRDDPDRVVSRARAEIKKF
jgi:tetratricopeptide (TPR) repeat protein